MAAEEDLFEDLGDLSDAFLEAFLSKVPEYVDTLVGKLPARTADVDTFWWLTAIGIALEEVTDAFRGGLQRRYQSYADYGLDTPMPYGPTRGLVEGYMASAAAGMNVKTRESILAGLRGDDLKNAVKDSVEKEIKQFIEALDTAFSAHDRIAMRNLGEQEGRGLWIYAGPADNRNRAFCADIVRRNSVFTAAGIEKLNEHPALHTYVPPNVAILCGGHGCRHLWLPVADNSGLLEGRDLED